MTAADPWLSGLRDALAAALAGWLPGRRWFGAADRRVRRVELVRVIELADHTRYAGPRGILVLAAVHLADADGGPDDVSYYQIPLGLRRVGTQARPGLSTMLEPELIVEVGDVWVYDATGDPELMSILLGLIAKGAVVGEVRFTPEWPPALTLAERAALPVRRGGAEQSNTSMIFGDRFILKLFRRLIVGVNPELEVHRGLRDAHNPYLATLLGSIEVDLDAGPVTLGVLHSYIPGAIDGWDLVTAAVRAAVDGDPARADLRSALRELGAAVAAVHAHLAESFGSAELTGPRVDSLKAELHARLAAAARAAPVLLDYLTALRGLVDDTVVPAGERIQRIHGDLHLGQALYTGSGWVLIDFEGEPATSIDQRVSWRSPLQDVAGMFRSLDYAVGQLRLTDATTAAPAEDWAAGAREAFWQGYLASSGARAVDRAALLRAYEVDKAAYEVVYETRNRPEWLPIPLHAITRLVDSPLGTDEPTDDPTS